MRSLSYGLFGVGIVSILTGCADTTTEESDVAEGAATSSASTPFDVDALKGRATKTFATPNGTTEICMIPAHFSEEGFTEKDLKKEAKLCRVDFNAAPGQEGVIAAGLSPKANSTNPATDIHEVTAAIGRDVVESSAEANARSRKAKKLGRLKSSLDIGRFGRTASYAPSMVGYYGTSRLLGNIAEVTPAVWRTLDVQRHSKVASQGKQLTVVGSQIVKELWASFEATDSVNGPKGNLTYTSDGAQLYGAFIAQVSGDAKDTEIDTLAGLQSSPRARILADVKPIANVIGKDFKSAAAAIVPLQGIVEMLVLDAIMVQGDRLSGDNVSNVAYMYFQKPDGTTDRMTKDDFDELAAKDPSSVPANAVPVKKLYLNDVDAGLIGNTTEGFQAGSEFGLLKRAAHISPDLYARVRKLADLTRDPNFEAFVRKEWRYNDRDWLRYSTMAGVVAKLLQDRCTSGALVLDLDIDKHIAGTNFGAGAGCQ